jgi:hypothetical protein
MEPLSENLVEETWQEIAHYDSDRATKEMMEFGQVQPDLLSFILEFTEDLDEQAGELAVYLLFVVYHMFRKGYGNDIKRVTAEEIIECYEENERLMERLEKAQDEFFNRVAEVQLSPQPYVIRYVVDSLSEEPEEDEDREPLSEEDVGYLFMLLKTVIDVLNMKTRE